MAQLQFSVQGFGWGDRQFQQGIDGDEKHYRNSQLPENLPSLQEPS